MPDARVHHRALARRIRGSVVEPGNPHYEAGRRIWNARFDRRPAAIVFVTGPDDVSAALEHAAEQNLSVAVRSGGHSPAGWSSLDGGLVIDLRGLDDTQIEADGLVTVASGSTAGDLARRLDERDLVLPLGTCAGVGVSGLALGGGLGHLNGCLGLTCDRLRWAEIVLPDGRRRIASATQEAELFWALRGAGANFGIVTRLGFRASRMAEGYGGAVAYHGGEHMPDIVEVFRDLCVNADDRLGLELRLLNSGAGTAAIILAFWAGNPREGEAALAGLRRLGAPASGGFAPLGYAAMASLDDGTGPHHAKYQRTANLDHLDNEAVAAIAGAHGADGTGTFMTLIHRRHGAAARLPVGEMAYPHRGTAFETTFVAAWTPGQDETGPRHRVDTAWTAIGGAARPAYVNMLDDEPSSRMAAVYGVHYQRLARLKALYDPANRLCSNANIEPSATLSAGEAGTITDARE